LRPCHIWCNRLVLLGTGIERGYSLAAVQLGNE
jgi:hypothetical protein